MCKAYANIFVCICYGEYFMKKILDKLHKTEKIHTKICFFTHSKKIVEIYQIARVTQKIMWQEVLYGNNNVMLCKVIKNNTAVLK